MLSLTKLWSGVMEHLLALLHTTAGVNVNVDSPSNI